MARGHLDISFHFWEDNTYSVLQLIVFVDLIIGFMFCYSYGAILKYYSMFAGELIEL